MRSFRIDIEIYKTCKFVSCKNLTNLSIDSFKYVILENEDSTKSIFTAQKVRSWIPQM